MRFLGNVSAQIKIKNNYYIILMTIKGNTQKDLKEKSLFVFVVSILILREVFYFIYFISIK